MPLRPNFRSGMDQLEFNLPGFIALARARIAQSAFTSLRSSSVPQETSKSRGDAMTIASACARDSATLRRLRLNRNSTPRGNSSPLEFKWPRQVQKFLSIYDQVANLFHFPRNKLSAIDYRAARAQAFSAWTEIAGAQLVA
jgi:hypothetical protein